MGLWNGLNSMQAAHSQQPEATRAVAVALSWRVLDWAPEALWEQGGRLVFSRGRKSCFFSLPPS